MHRECLLPATGGAVAEACTAEQQNCAQGAVCGRLVQARRQQPDQAGEHLCRSADKLLGQVCLPAYSCSGRLLPSASTYEL